MASYTAAQLYGTGSVGENISGETIFTFINNGYSSYFTLETNPNPTGSFAGRPKCASGSWTVSASMFPTTGAYVASVVVQPGSSSLLFTPATSVTGIDYHLRGTGTFTLSITPSIPITASSFVAFGSYSTNTTPPGGYFDITNFNVWYTASLSSSAFTLANSRFATGSGIATDGSSNWVVVGRASGSLASGSYSIFNSTNGKTWAPISSSRISGSVEYRNVAWGYTNNYNPSDKTWVAVGSGSIAVSAVNNASWTYNNSSTYNGLRVVYNGKDGTGANLWLAVGDFITAAPPVNIFGYYTVDPNGTWLQAPSDMDTRDVSAYYSLGYDNATSLWTAGVKPAAGGTNIFIYTCTDPNGAAGGANWIPIVQSANIFTTACYAVLSLGGSNWLVGGDKNSQGPIFSFDGSTIQSLNVTLLDTCYSLAYDGTNIVAVGKKAATNGVVIYSTDGGNSWSTSTSTTPVWGDGFAIAAANRSGMYP
jgi:hypothetical protein